MKLISRIDGEIEYNKEDIINFEKGLLGFENCRKYILKDLEDYKPFKILQSVDDEKVGMIVISTYDFFKDYDIKLNDETVRNLNLQSAKDAMVITTLTLNSDVQKITTNLQGPIIINMAEKKGEQIILDNPKFKTKQPLVKE